MKTDTISTVNNSVRLFPELEMQTGLSSQEINADLKDKAEVLKWLSKKKIDNVDDVGKVISTYYTNKANLMKFISKK
ncbi:MAG: hypothetical protein ISS82_05540 [Nanoarchaeota archaeon]|nr:hypothetical protein [Nanoarchaeota archaeon]